MAEVRETGSASVSCVYNNDVLTVSANGENLMPQFQISTKGEVVKITKGDLTLASNECEQLIARGEGIGFEAATVATPAGPKMMTNVRNNDRVTFDDGELAGFLWGRIKPYLPAQIDGWTASGLNERFRFYRYDASQRFNAHRDGVVAIVEVDKGQ